MMTSLQMNHPGVRRTTLAAVWVSLIGVVTFGSLAGRAIGQNLRVP